MTFADYQFCNLHERERQIERQRYENHILRRLAEITWAVKIIHGFRQRRGNARPERMGSRITPPAPRPVPHPPVILKH